MVLSAAQVREKRKAKEDAKSARQHASDMTVIKNITEALVDEKEVQSIYCNAFIVSRLKELGFKVRYNKACGMGDISSHTISLP